MKLTAACCLHCGKELPSERHKNNKLCDSVCRKAYRNAAAKRYYYENQEQQKILRQDHYRKTKAEYLERSYEWRKTNKEARALSERKRMLSKLYGLSWESYNSLFESQQGKCKICSVQLTSIASKNTNTAACVDHCHTTGKVRGLLCRPCNLLLGNAKDNPEVLKNAITYLHETGR